MGPHLILVLLGTMTLTAYRSVPNQTDDTPYVTSTGESVDAQGVAVSQDLLCPRAFGATKTHKREACYFPDRIHYGDWIYVEGFGPKIVNDTMHTRHAQHVDVWVKTYAQEKAFGLRRGRVWKMNQLVP